MNNINTIPLFININLKLKKLYGFLLMMLVCFVGYGQSATIYTHQKVVNWQNWKDDFTISLLLATDESINEQKAYFLKNELQGLFDVLDRKKLKHTSDQKLLAAVFAELFDSHLHNYKALTTFTKTMEQKEFDCLTGTLLFALSLEKLGFQYAIHETNNHVYLTVQTSEGEVLIETTDRKFGLEKNKHLIAKRRKEYQRQYEQAKENTKNAFTSFFKIERQIDLTELIGLQYFNKAVNAYNQKSYEQSINFLKQSIQLYDAERSTELMVLSIKQYLQMPTLQSDKKEKLLQYEDFYVHKLAAKLSSSKTF